MDSNRPVSYRIVDSVKDNKVLASYSSIQEALKHCQELEPEPSYNGNWRYNISPVRPCDDA